jgi:hypothetical protein
MSIDRGEWRVYCREDDCGFERVFSDDSSDEYSNPERAAYAHGYLHESKRSGHWCRVECLSDQNVEQPRDGGMILCGELDNEDELQQWLEDYFEEHGWTAIREVSPHNSNQRADLIVQHDDFGWIGIETKYFDGDGGAKAAKAHHQITRQYRGKTYLTDRIDKWAICPYFWGIKSPDYIAYEQPKYRSTFIREFFCRHGIGFIDLERRDMLIDFAYSDLEMKIPVAGPQYEKFIEEVDIQKIEKYVSKKRSEYDYV